MKSAHYLYIMKTKLLFVVAFLMLCPNLHAQNVLSGKLSYTLRQLVYQDMAKRRAKSSSNNRKQEILALVKCTDPKVLEEEGCYPIRNWDNIYATSIPLNQLKRLAERKEIQRIEAGRTCQICVDTTATLLGVREIWNGFENHTGLTGRDVVMGIQDIGFDLTHPTFYSRDLKKYRIKAFWDMLDPDSIGSNLYVGRDYTTQVEIQKKAHATDGLKQTHGVHTAGIAAGSGYNTPYSGMAPEADLCLVSNAVSSDKEFISEENMYKYTSTTDILGFQYIFDYAEKMGKPCVISFSEGAHEDLYGDAQLLYEVLEKMVGPGRIIVASAGNSSVNNTYLHKPQEQEQISSFIYSNSEVAYYTLRHSDKTKIDLHFSHSNAPAEVFQTLSFTTEEICQMEDSLYMDTLTIEDEQYLILLASYPSCYNPDEWATELYVKVLTQSFLGVGYNHRLRLTLNGKDTDVECFASGGLFLNISSLPQYCTAKPTHNINFPAAAPSIIAVGGTAYRRGATNYKGEWKGYDMGEGGIRWAYSSVGPTMQGLTKPDVMAPACNIISAYSSYYIENNPNANDVNWDVEHFNFNGRTYAWNCNSGTSMSSPIVGGIVALWLQLCPTLTPNDILEVIQMTSKRYDTSLSYPNNDYGWGEIDALEGAKYITRHFDCTNHIENVELDTPEIENQASSIFDLTGRRISCSKHTHGIYIIQHEGSLRKIAK